MDRLHEGDRGIYRLYKLPTCQFKSQAFLFDGHTNQLNPLYQLSTNTTVSCVGKTLDLRLLSLARESGAT